MKHWTINDLKVHAKLHNIPIIHDEALLYIQDYIKTHNIKSILEIGTAYGYSAVSLANKTTHVDTIERDPNAILEANIWVKRLNANVTLHAADALTYKGIQKTYDLIFIDAAKSQYETFFNKYSKYLNDGGTIICDNIHFHHLTIETAKTRSTKSLLKKIAAFKKFLLENEAFETKILDIGDGLAVSKKRT